MVMGPCLVNDLNIRFGSGHGDCGGCGSAQRGQDGYETGGDLKISRSVFTSSMNRTDPSKERERGWSFDIPSLPREKDSLISKRVDRE